MKRFLLAAFCVLAFVGSAAAQGISAKDVAGKPEVFCNVLQEPDPLLLGGWKCYFARKTEEGTLETNPAQFWLVKHGDQYGLYFYRIARSGRKRYIGWRSWTINGSTITSDTGVTISAQDGAVYFQWQDEKPVKMERISSR